MRAFASTGPELGDAREAFRAAYTVLMHPRCMNCHPAADAPLQGDDSHVHIQNVKAFEDAGFTALAPGWPDDP